MMNIAAWKDANDDVSAKETTTTTRLEQDKEEAVIVTTATTNGKTVNKKPLSNPSSSSSSAWMRSKDPRIVRVSRAFGGKDRHSKVCTLRGLRDRRVRLSVPTAIQLYDLQERLGVDQPSKAVDWLLNVAKDEIDELPPLPISPEHFSLLHNHNHHHQPGQDPTQFGFKINTSVEESQENKERRENDIVLSNNGDYNSYNLDQHHQNSSFQTDYHHHHHLVPFPTTIQSLFPSSSSSRTDGSRNHFEMPLMGNNNSSSSNNISSLYSLLHGSGNSGNSNSRMFSSSVEFNGGNTMSRFVGSDSSTSRGSDDQQM